MRLYDKGFLLGRMRRGKAIRTLLVQAFAMAPEPFRQRIAQSVQASGDRAVLDAYRRAQDGSGVDPAQDICDARRFENKATQVDAWLVDALDCKDVKL